MGDPDIKGTGRHAVERFSGTVKKVAGSVLHDKRLEEQGELEQRAVDLGRRAAAGRADAARRRHRADVRIREAELAADRAELAAQEGAEEDRVRILGRQEAAERGIERRRETDEEALEARRSELHAAVARSEATAADDQRRGRAGADRMDHAADDARRRARELDPEVDRRSP